MAGQVCLRVEQFRKLAALKFKDNDGRELSDEVKARRMQLDPATYSRVTRGKQAPGNKFISAVLTTFAPDGFGFDDLFVVIAPDDEQVPA